MKPSLLSLTTTNQFAGLHQEDQSNHLATFYELCETLGTNFNDEEVVYLMLFPISVTRRVKIWLQSHSNQNLTNWVYIKGKFLARFFPPSKYISVKIATLTFSQGLNEHFCEAWERYKVLLKNVPTMDSRK